MKKIKIILKKMFCNHKFKITRWHYVHDPTYAPSHIEVEYKCERCNKLIYKHLYIYKNKDFKYYGLDLDKYE